MEHMIGLTDTAYLGRVGEVELGASALAGVYYLVIYMLGFGFSVGAQVLMARRNGEGSISGSARFSRKAGYSFFCWRRCCLRPLICLHPICSTG